MKTIILNYFKIKNTARRRTSGILFLSALVLVLAWSCQKEDEKTALVPLAGKISVSTSGTTLILSQKNASNTAVTFTWTTGSNQGTGASISYTFQLDKKGNDFKTAITLNLGKCVYTQAYTVSDLEDSVRTRWNFKPDTVGQLEARVIATVSSSLVKPDTSNVLSISVTPYTPVTSTLFIVGDATPNGWDIGNATRMTPDVNDPTIFSYTGLMNVGDFKFPVNRNTNWGQNMYEKSPTDSTKMYLHIGGAPDDSKWHIYTGGRYMIVVSLLDLTIKITKLPGPAYDVLYMVGDATPNGWDISNATQLVQDATNPFLFSYDGILLTGDFKFPVNRNTDWGQNMYERDTTVLDSTKMYLHIGGHSDDNKWHISTPAFYSVKLNLANNTILYRPVTNIFIVGSATSIGWTISSAIQLTQDPTNKYIYTFTGPLTAGEFKFPVNRNADWGQDMFMRTDVTHMYYHHGGNSDDNKWQLAASDAGNYIITINLQDMTINIQKQ